MEVRVRYPLLQDGIPCMALNGLSCQGYPAIDLVKADIKEIPAKGSSTQKMIFVQKKLSQSASIQYCRSLCMQLLGIHEEDDAERLVDWLYYYISVTDAYYTSLQISESGEVTTMINKDSTEIFGGNDALLFHPNSQGSDYDLLRVNPSEAYSFICTQSIDDTPEGPESQSFVRKAYYTTADEYQPSVVELVQNILLPYFSLSVENNYIEDRDFVIAPEYMTLQKAQNYCENILNGTLFEPRSIEDIDLIHQISTKYEIQDLWLGIKATDSTVFPRDSNHWKYLSESSVGITTGVFEKLDEDNGQAFVGNEYCTHIRGEVYMTYNQKTQKLLDSRSERLIGTLCTVPRAPLESMTTVPNESMTQVPCHICTKVIHSIIGLLQGEDFFKWIEQECRTGFKSLFKDIEGDVCHSMIQYIIEIIQFLRKYSGWILCHHWNSCSYEEANAFRSGQFVHETLPCATCKEKLNIVRGTIANLLQSKEDQICFIFDSVLDFKLGCKMLQLEREYAHQIVENLLQKIGTDQMCPACAPSPSHDESTMPRIGIPTNTLILQIFNKQSDKCLKYHDGKIVVTGCDCKNHCPEGDRDFETLQWWISGPRIVSLSEGKALSISQENSTLLTLSPYDESDKRQEWTLLHTETEGEFMIENDHHFWILAQLESSLDTDFVSIGALPGSGHKNQVWYFKIVK